MGKFKHIEKDDFKEEVINSNKPSMVDFWAKWCAPCKKMEPIINNLQEEFSGKINFFKLDVDANPSVAAEYGVRGVPALFFFKNGEVVDRIVGVASRKEIVNKLKKLL